MDRITELAVKEVLEKYNPHTIIVYGSRARGEATETSDIDIACFTDSLTASKDAREFHNVFLDAWIYPTEAMENVTTEFLRFGDGFCASDKKGIGEIFLQKVREKIDLGPDLLSCEDKAHAKEWAMKMLSRAAQNDIEANSRRVWLQFELLQIYFQFRDQWYFGPKKSFSWLKENDPKGYEIFQASYSNTQSHELLKKLAEYATSV